MNLLRLLLLGLACVSPAYAKVVPTPDMAISVGIGADSTKWVQKFMDGTSSGIILELLPKGQSIDGWKEMVRQQIAFTDVSLRKYVDTWEAMLRRTDPKITIKEEPQDDGSLIVTFTSLAAKETSVRRFFKASDGIYMLAYHVRPAFRTESRFRLWHDIIAAATLVRNTAKRR